MEQTRYPLKIERQTLIKLPLTEDQIAYLTAQNSLSLLGIIILLLKYH